MSEICSIILQSIGNGKEFLRICIVFRKYFQIICNIISTNKSQSLGPIAKRTKKLIGKPRWWATTIVTYETALHAN